MNTKFFEEFSDNTEVKLYFNQIKRLVEAGQNTDDFKDFYLPMVEKSRVHKGSCFLSVIIRTQGKRRDGLREALLCLNAQSCQDFEIILIGHKLEPEQEKIVDEILEDQEEEFRKKIRYFKLNRDGRAAPLNFGFANAYGQYAAVYDDDDILFADWVKNFKKAAEKNYGRILHSYAFSQNWMNTERLGYRATGAPAANYCLDFNIIDQLVVNRCPLMTLAFPVNMFQELGLMFDETLNVTEDWEYFMRLAFMCGVSDIRESTAIYRFWDNIETSATLHNQDDWSKTYQKIQESFNERSALLPCGSTQRLIAMLTGQNVPVAEGPRGVLSKLYYSIGDPFHENNCIIACNDKLMPQFDLWFLFEEKRDDVTAMRFDLTEDGLFGIKDLEIVIWFTNGEKHVLNVADDCVHNGVNYKDMIVFLHEDPEIVWEFKDERSVDVIHISGTMTRSLPRSWLLRILEALMMLSSRSKRKQLHEKGLF